MNFFIDIILAYCFDSQCLSECCPSSTTVDKKSTTGKEKAADSQQEPFPMDIYKVYSNAVNIMPASYIILQFFEIALPFMY